MRKVAIVGKSPKSRGAVPVMDPTWEIWAIGIDDLPRIDRVFELHNEDLLEEVIWGTKLRDMLRAKTCPVYMQRRFDDIPTSVAYPLDEVIQTIGRDYFASSFAFMIALAIHEKVDQIGVWGVDLNTYEEYAYQRPNAEYLLGIAKGKGIKVKVPPNTSLLHSPGRYGWDQEVFAAQAAKDKAAVADQLKYREAELAEIKRDAEEYAAAQKEKAA